MSRISTKPSDNLDLSLIHGDDEQDSFYSFHISDVYAAELLRLDTPSKLASRPDSVAGVDPSVGTPIYLTDKDVRLLHDLIQATSANFKNQSWFLEYVYDGQSGYDRVFSGIRQKLDGAGVNVKRSNNLLRDNPKKDGFISGLLFRLKSLLGGFYA